MKKKGDIMKERDQERMEEVHNMRKGGERKEQKGSGKKGRVREHEERKEE